jgi:hypothetical protein
MWVYGEDLLQFLWKKQLFKNTHFTDLQNRPITILNPGILNKNSGPDFENARIKIGQVELIGSIEIHINESSWYNHKHQTDKAYNNVILHVCYSAKEDVTSEDGSKIPTLALEKHIDTSVLARYQNLLSNESFIPCEFQIHMVSSYLYRSWIERMGIERLESKTVYAESLLEKFNYNWNQLAYTLILRSMGMPINTDAFEELANRLPYELIAKHSSSVFQLEALLLGCAGLIDPSENDYAAKLFKEFSFLKEKYGLISVQQRLKKGRMRPASLPHVKLALFAAFLHQKPDLKSFYTSQDILPLLQNIQASEFWDTHYSFSSESTFKPKRYSLEAIRHLVLNAIAPFLFLYAKKKHLDFSVIEMLQGFKPEKNSIIKRWESVGIKPDSAFDSQALLHLYKQYCKPKRCLDCHIGQSLLSK